jgi:O-antigen/teichoic acid export membrane protein
VSEAPLQVGKLALRGGLISGLSQGVKVGVQLLSAVVLARLLVPEDFGLVAAVGPVVAFVALFQNLGLEQAIVQRREITERLLNRLFWVMTGVGLACTAAVALVSPAVAWFYGDPRMGGITVFAGVPLLLGSAAALPLSLLARELRFGRLAIIDIAGALLGFIAAAIGASNGLGYWSLLLGSAASASGTLVGAWWRSRWKPGSPKFAIDPDIVSFGANLTGFNLVNFFARNLDNILIGRFYGVVDLGYYDRAYKLLLFPIQNFNVPLSRVMIPLLSRIQDDKPRFRELYLRTVWLLSTATVPGIAALACTPEQVVSVLFGERWQAVAPIFAWLAVAGLIQPASNTTGWVFICQGKTKVMFHWGVYSSATAAAAFVVGLQWGAVGVAAAYAISGYVLRVPVLAFLMHRVGPATALDFLKVQFLFLASSFATWVVFKSFPGLFLRASGMLTVVLVAALSYALAGLLMFALPGSRRIATDLFRKAVSAAR